MRYLSFDMESTGLSPNDLMIELACVAFDSETRQVSSSLRFHTLIKCPPFETLAPKLSPWVREHNKELITQASKAPDTLPEVKKKFELFLQGPEVQEYFQKEPIVLFGKSLSALDLPFLNRDFGADFMRRYFHHRTLDLTSFVYGLIDMGRLPKACESGSELMKHFSMGDVAHTAMEDALNTITLYFKIMESCCEQ